MKPNMKQIVVAVVIIIAIVKIVRTVVIMKNMIIKLILDNNLSARNLNQIKKMKKIIIIIIKR